MLHSSFLTFFLFTSPFGMEESSYSGPARIFMCFQVLTAVSDADPEVFLGVGVQYVVLASLGVLWMCWVGDLELVL